MDTRETKAAVPARGDERRVTAAATDTARASAQRFSLPVTVLLVALATSAALAWERGAAADIRRPSPQLPSVAPSRLDQLFEEFWRADSSNDALEVGRRIAASGVSFDEVLRRLQHGRRYRADVDTGEVRWISPHSPRVGVRTLVLVPQDYDPSFVYPVRIQLHGAVGLDAPRGSVARRRLDARFGRRLESSRATIHVLPRAFADAQWWFANQVDNLRWIVDRLKRHYNIDENQVHLLGVSDGATGTLFFAMRDTTPWSSFVALNGHPKVLTNPSLEVDGELHASNLVNKPLYIVNGDRDPQYPAWTLEPYVQLFRRVGADVVFRARPQVGRDMSWWDDEQVDVDDFVDGSTRDPLPSRLSWQTERVDRYNRAHWLVITRLGNSAGQADLPDENQLIIDTEGDFGMRVDLAVDSGRRIIEVLPGTDAASTGLMKGDLIREIDGRRVRNGRQILQAMSPYPGTRSLTFLVERGGGRVTMASPFPPTAPITRQEPAFPRSLRAGRIDLVQRGNSVEAQTRGVEAFRLLISPQRFDFSRPVVVAVNGRELINRRLAPSVSTLMKWAAIDNDRTMLFGAEVEIEIPE